METPCPHTYYGDNGHLNLWQNFHQQTNFPNPYLGNSLTDAPTGRLFCTRWTAVPGRCAAPPKRFFTRTAAPRGPSARPAGTRGKVPVSLGPPGAPRDTR